MSLVTRSVFYYGLVIDSQNQNINFNEGASELTAQVSVGDYTLEGLMTAIQTSLNDSGALTYTVSVDRDTRFVTIAASGSFNLLVSSGSQVGTSPFSLIGFTGADRSGAATYTGDSGAGSEFLPQFILQDYIESQNQKQFIETNILESASGQVQVVTYGRREIFDMTMRYITDIDQRGSGVIETDLTAVAKARAFMDFATTKAKMEFMPDRLSRSTKFDVLLESTPENNKGTDYILKEQLSDRLPGYFTTGVLKFRVVT